MKANSTQMEILLMTGTSFLKYDWYNNADPENRAQLTEKERLAEACWNGLLQEMLPEICEEVKDGEQIFLWQIKEGSSFLEIELGQAPYQKENNRSIDPYAFMGVQSYN